MMVTVLKSGMGQMRRSPQKRRKGCDKCMAVLYKIVLVRGTINDSLINLLILIVHIIIIMIRMMIITMHRNCMIQTATVGQPGS